MIITFVETIFVFMILWLIENFQKLHLFEIGFFLCVYNVNSDQVNVFLLIQKKIKKFKETFER